MIKCNEIKAKVFLYSYEHRFLELMLVLGSQPTGDRSHKPGGRIWLPLLSAMPAVTSLATEHHCSLADTSYTASPGDRGMYVKDLPRVALDSNSAAAKS